MNISKRIKQLIRSLPDHRDPFGVYGALYRETNEVPLEDRYDPSLLNLNIACVVGDYELADALLRRDDVDPGEIWQEEYYFYLYMHPDIVRLLLEDGRMNPGLDNSYPIFFASENGLVESLRLLLIDGRADPTIVEDFRSVISFAAEYEQLEVVRLLLLDGRADPAAGGNEALIIAATQGDEEMVALLMRDGRVDPSDQDNQATREAIAGKHWGVVYLLAQDRKVMRSLKKDEKYIAEKVLRDY